MPGNAAGLAAEAGTAMNAQRAGSGRAPLARDSRLDAAAQAHACWMSASGTFSHQGQGGSGSMQRIQSAGYPSRLGAENIALGQTSAGAVVTDWMGSAGHRKNILLAGAEAYGVGVALLGGRQVWVMVFAGG